MIAPTPPAIALCIVLTALGLLAGFFPPASSAWIILSGLAIGSALLDLALCLKRPGIALRRTVHHILPVTAWSTVELEASNHDGRAFSVLLHDLHQPEFLSRGLPTRFVLAPKHNITCKYDLFPTRRGKFHFTGADMIVKSPLHLWQKKWFLPCSDTVMVFPNFREIGRYALLATQHDLSRIGIKKLLRRGEGMEFHQLREFRQGDSLQKIDWKASSRHRKLISKEFQDERDQQIVFILDSGRRMAHAESDKTHFDQALNSILLLAYVASRQGDAVGLYSFGGTAKWHPPRREEDAVRSLLLTVYDIEASANSADYLKAAQELPSLQKRRALMIIITNSRAEDHDDLMQMAKQLRRKHLVVIADIREKILDEFLRRPIGGFEDALRYQALQQYLIERDALLRQLTHLGVLALDVTAERLPVALVNSYLEIKSSGRL